jgi:hypothetical protein
MNTRITSTNGLRAFAIRHQMALLVLLMLIISWAFVVPAKRGLISHGPMIAAFIVLAVVGPRRAVRGLLEADDALAGPMDVVRDCAGRSHYGAPCRARDQPCVRGKHHEYRTCRVTFGLPWPNPASAASPLTATFRPVVQS